MDDPGAKLANAEPLDLAEVAARCGERFPELARLGGFRCGDQPLIRRIQSVLDAVREDPPPAPPAGDDPVMRPWWTPMPAAYMAALFEHVGLPEASGIGRSAPGVMLPHWRESLRATRRILRALGVPFAVREAAASLVLHQEKALNLPRSGAPAETYMALACAVDLRSLYWLRRADLRAAGEDDGDGLGTLEAFRERAESVGVFDGPPAPALSEDEARQLGIEDARARHRARNAARYFALVARMGEAEWFRERLRQERDRGAGRFHLLVGPAGCGKSTWATERLDETRVVSSDRMRLELTGDPADQSQNYLVFQRCMDRVRELLREGRDVTFDATNYSEELRSMPVQAARWSGAEIASYYFDVSLEAALARNRSRQRMVPEAVVRKHYRLIEPPRLYEADRHVVVSDEGEPELYWPLDGA